MRSCGRSLQWCSVFAQGKFQAAGLVTSMAAIYNLNTAGWRAVGVFGRFGPDGGGNSSSAPTFMRLVMPTNVGRWSVTAHMSSSRGGRTAFSNNKNWVIMCLVRTAFSHTDPSCHHGLTCWLKNSGDISWCFNIFQCSNIFWLCRQRKLIVGNAHVCQIVPAQAAGC